MKIISQKQWTDATFSNEAITKENLSGFQFDDCEFTGCEFTECDLRNTSFENCLFDNCLISNCNLSQSKMGEVLFSTCKLVGLNFSGCKKLLFSIKLQDCNMQLCNFSQLKMMEHSLEGSTIQDCDFYQTNLEGAVFNSCDLKGSLFDECNLSEADFRSAKNYNINPAQNKLKKAIFSMPEVLAFLEPLGIVVE